MQNYIFYYYLFMVLNFKFIKSQKNNVNNFRKIQLGIKKKWVYIAIYKFVFPLVQYKPKGASK